MWIGLSLVALGCSAQAPRRSSTSASGASSATTASRDALREARALLLLMADQRRFEPIALRALLDSSPEIREALAVAIGAIGDARGRTILQGLLVDGEAPVRRAAAFALGELGAPDAVGSLLRVVVDDDAETGALAVEALGKLQAPLADLSRALTALEPDEADRRLAPFLFRFPGDGFVEAARSALASPQPEVRMGAAYALGRVPVEAALPLLRELVADPEPRARAAAARALGEVGDLTDLSLLEPLLAEPQVSPRIQALRAGARILGRNEALPPLSWGTRLAVLASDSAPGVRATAIESSFPWLGQAEVRAAILRAADDGEPRERELALLALAKGGDADAEARVRRAANDPARLLRARAAEAAGALGLEEIVGALAADSEPLVRVAALSARLESAAEMDERAGDAVALATDATVVILREALADPDPTVRATALDALAERPALPAAALAAALAATAGDRLIDARLAAIRALTARGKANENERADVSEFLRLRLEDRDALVRREAAQGLVDMGFERPEIGPVETGKRGPAYALVLEQTERARFVDLTTERGTLGLRLDCPQAPLTCLSFLQLAAQGYFDGLVFHRVVPDFVVQAGDPRGDGWGGPGYSIRDEIHRGRYVRGTVGMALSGPDTGGSQFFLTLSPQPHLDGGYTVFGQLVSGAEVLDSIRQGDRILEVREVVKNE